MIKESQNSSKFPLTQLQISLLKSEAKKVKKEEEVPHSEALDLVAVSNGFESWKDLLSLNPNPERELDFSKVTANMTPLGMVEVSGVPFFGSLLIDLSLDIKVEDWKGNVSLSRHVIQRGMLKFPMVVQTQIASTLYPIVRDEIKSKAKIFLSSDFCLSNSCDFLDEEIDLSYSEYDFGCVKYPFLLKSPRKMTWGDCWVKTYEKPNRDEDGYAWVDGILCDVWSPGSHPGGNAYWLNPVAEVLVYETQFGVKDSHSEVYDKTFEEFTEACDAIDSMDNSEKFFVIDAWGNEH